MVIVGLIVCIILCLMAGGACGEDKTAFTTVGGYVAFGAYEQDNNTENGKEPIEWLVLDYDASTQRVLLISRYGLDARQVHRTDPFPTWARCDIREWLNGQFLNDAFSAQEQTAIVETYVSTPIYNGHTGGKDTLDRVFLLSRQEVEEYFANEELRQAVPTEYAKAQGAWQEGGLGGSWWLRSPGDYGLEASKVAGDGAFGVELVFVDMGIRPAIVLDLNAL